MAATDDTSDLEPQARALIGQFVLVYARLDTNLALYVASRRDAQEEANALARLNDTSFQAKLTQLQRVTRKAFADNDECLAQWTAWVARADALRLTRNDFMHGRWGFSKHQGIAANVVGLPGTPEQRERRYTLEQLHLEVDAAQSVLVDFHALADRWPL